MSKTVLSGKSKVSPSRVRVKERVRTKLAANPANRKMQLRRAKRGAGR